MPEPLLYLKAMGAAAIVSASLMLATVVVLRNSNRMWLTLASVVAIGGGLAAGYHVLSLQLAWPTKNGLERFLMLVVPAALAFELIAGIDGVPHWVAWILRLSLTAALPRILLHGSVYISGPYREWNLVQACTVLGVSGLLLTGVWVLLSWLSQHSPGFSIPLSLNLSTLCAGLTVMMAGYIKGGTTALPLAATLLATSIISRVASKRLGVPGMIGLPAIIGVGVVGLYGLLFIGRFFGQLSTGHALAILLAPLLCWTTELPRLRHQNPLFLGSLRLVLVMIPLALVLFLAKRDFDRDMAPLLVNSEKASVLRQCEVAWYGTNDERN